VAAVRPEVPGPVAAAAVVGEVAARVVGVGGGASVQVGVAERWAVASVGAGSRDRGG